MLSAVIHYHLHGMTTAIDRCWRWPWKPSSVSAAIQLSVPFPHYHRDILLRHSNRLRHLGDVLLTAMSAHPNVAQSHRSLHLINCRPLTMGKLSTCHVSISDWTQASFSMVGRWQQSPASQLTDRWMMGERDDVTNGNRLVTTFY